MELLEDYLWKVNDIRQRNMFMIDCVFGAVCNGNVIQYVWVITETSANHDDKTITHRTQKQSNEHLFAAGYRLLEDNVHLRYCSL